VQRQTVRQAGAIRRISVAVLVDGITSTGPDGAPAWEPRPDSELQALRDLVIAAIGFDEARGDIVTVESMAFQPDETAGSLVEVSALSRFLERNVMTLIQIGVLSLVVLILALTVIRPILTRRLPNAAASAVLAGPGGVAGAGAPALAEIAGQPGLPTPEGGEQARVPDNASLRRAVAERPDQVVSMLREWLEPNDDVVAKEEPA